MNHRRPTRRGFSLVEAALATLLVGSLAVALLQTAGGVALARNRAADLITARALADQLLAEILRLPFRDPAAQSNLLGPLAGETRSTFNDIDDYDGLVESPPAGSDTLALDDAAQWQRAVTVLYLSESNYQATSRSSYSSLKIITVTVSRAGQTLSSVSAVRGTGWDLGAAYPEGITSANVSRAPASRTDTPVNLVTP